MALRTEYNEKYLNEVIERHGNIIYRISMLNLKNKENAEDIFQQTFLTLVEKKARFNDENHELAWLIKVCNNKSKDHYKNYWNKRTEALNKNFSKEEEEDLSEVFYAVSSLHSKYKIPIYLFYYEGYSTKEIASKLGKKEATIRTHLRRGRLELKKLLEGVDIFE